MAADGCDNENTSTDRPLTPINATLLTETPGCTCEEMLLAFLHLGMHVGNAMHNKGATPKDMKCVGETTEELLTALLTIRAAFGVTMKGGH